MPNWLFFAEINWVVISEPSAWISARIRADGLESIEGFRLISVVLLIVSVTLGGAVRALV